jgi:hypothetical protein
MPNEQGWPHRYADFSGSWVCETDRRRAELKFHLQRLMEIP